MKNDEKNLEHLTNRIKYLERELSSLKTRYEKDITERFGYEETLKYQQERLKYILEGTNVGTWEWNVQTGETVFNDRWAEMIGYTLEEISPVSIETWKKHTHPEDLFLANNALQAHFSKEKEFYETEFRMLHKNGEWIWVLDRGKVVSWTDKGEPLWMYGTHQDISERKKMEFDLKSTTEELHRYFNSSLDLLCIANTQGYFLRLNPEWENVLGYKIEDLEGKLFLDLVHPDDLPATLNAISKLDAQMEVLSFENRYRCKDGQYRWIEWRSRPHGHIIYAAARDITARKYAEEALLDSRENLFITLHSIGDGVITTDRQGKVTNMNPVAEKLCGIRLTEAAGKDLHDIFVIIDADSGAVIKNPMHTVFATGQMVGLSNNTLLQSKDGKEYNISDSAAPIKNKSGEITGMVLVFSDVTEKYAIQKSLIQSERKFRSIVESAPLGMHFYQLLEDNRLVFIGHNLAANHLLGIDNSQFIGKTLEEAFPPLAETDVPVKYRKAAREGEMWKTEQIHYEEAKIKGAFEVTAFQTEPGFMVAMFSEITERKRAEQALMDARNRAIESDRLKTAFLANMSHEIRTPMNGILGFADLLKDPNLTGEEQQKYIEVIEKSGVRMLSILNDIIDISKIEAGLMKLNTKETFINEITEYTYTFFKPEAENKGLTLHLANSLSSADAIIQTDSEKLYAILSNLVKNAIKYTTKGKIQMGYIKKNDFFEFFVKDTGIGIPATRLHAIFERFIQADLENRNAYQGAGLGLAISKAYVEMLGGKIWVKSEEGKGSEFCFTIPSKPANLTENHKKNSDFQISTPSANRKFKILIAEDDSDSAHLLDIMVRDQSKETLIVNSGKDAVEICRLHPDIDIVLMDVRMPGMDGYEATQEIRKFNQQIIIIAQTAFALTGDSEKAILAGCNDYISKPINKVKLQTVINKHLA